DVLHVMKGQVGLRTQLTFAGGTIGNRTLDVAGVPQFAAGDRDVLFVSPDRNAVSPLLGVWHGRFRVEPDPVTGEALVRTFDGKPVLVGCGARSLGAGGSGPLTLSRFESAVRQRLQVRGQPR